VCGVYSSLKYLDMYSLSFKLVVLLVVKFEVLTAVVMKSSIFWDISPCSPLKIYRRFGGAELFATCFILVPFLADSFTLKMEATCFSEKSVYFQRTKRRYIPCYYLIAHFCA
jgi:hypothetical protein